MIYYFIGGAIMSSLLAVPFILWARDKGSYAYSNGRARGLKNFLFAEAAIV